MNSAENVALFMEANSAVEATPASGSEELIFPGGELFLDYTAHALIAEDCRDTQDLLAYLLQRLGLKVATADDGEQCVRMVVEAEQAGRPFDVLLVDLRMPVMDGCTAVRWLRKEGFNFPIIAITAGPSLGDRRESLHAGCDTFLAKTELRHTLVPTLKMFLEKH